MQRYIMVIENTTRIRGEKVTDTTAAELIRELKERGVTKWTIKKRLRCHWNTVNLWSKGAFNPTQEHLAALKAMLAETQQS